MNLQFNCPHCDTLLAIDEKWRNAKVECPNCGNSLIPEKAIAKNEKVERVEKKKEETQHKPKVEEAGRKKERDSRVLKDSGIPNCPKCGSIMVIRIAKRGPNTGHKFYGCSRYPRCKATIPYDSTTSTPSSSDTKSPSEILFPQTLVARVRYENLQVRFFQAVAVSEYLLETISDGHVNEEILNALSQWRIDYPISEPCVLGERQSQMISVLEKILTRGRITLVSPRLEEDLREIFPSCQSRSPMLLIESLVFGGYKEKQDCPWLDSKEETIFYEDILPRMLGDNYKRFVLPQVAISSLVGANRSVNAAGYGRVDFAIFHPRIEEKIIVEIDGDQHDRQLDSDADRDRILEECGYEVIRIQASEIQEGTGEQLLFLESRVSTIREQLAPLQSEDLQFLCAIKLAHQIQVALLQAIQSGFLRLEDVGSWNITSDLDKLTLLDKGTGSLILTKSLADFMELLRKLGKLYSVEVDEEGPRCSLSSESKADEPTNAVFISFSNKHTSNLPTLHVQNIYCPFPIASSCFPTPPAIGGLGRPEVKDLEYFLRYLFRKESFWEGQYDGIVRALEGEDALLLLPTGAGKSLVYQLASFLLPGRTMVVDPIISLMEDQIDNLAMVGIDRSIAITSQIADASDRSKAMELFGQGQFLFTYVAPERFQSVEFRNSIKGLTVHTPVALIVVDEAHCVSEWGHDFRTAYLNIGRTTRALCGSNQYTPPLLAMTGTASRAVLKDVQRELRIDDFDAIITPKSFDRVELKFHVIAAGSQEKSARLKGYLGQMLPSLFGSTSSSLYQTRGKETYSGLVFCPYVGSEFGIERVSNEIRSDLGIRTEIYGGRPPKYWQYDQYRNYKHRVTKEFKRNKIPLLVCTKAFGMGIDKPNIRYTIHFGIPPSIESFYQEAGRAGRDRKVAHCCIIVSNDDPARTEQLLAPNTAVEDVDAIVSSLKWEEHDDITRVLRFHTNSFRGIAEEKQDVEEILHHLGDLSKKREQVLTIPDNIKRKGNKYRKDREIAERAIYRLLLLGIVTDYTIDYSREEFTIQLSGADKEKILEAFGEYVAGYQYGRKAVEMAKASQFLSMPFLNFVSEILGLLLEFIYVVIERGRRQALSTMLGAITASPLDKDIRARIVRYLETTEYSESLEKIIDDNEAGLTECQDLFSAVRSPNEAAELRGQVSRYLESYPDHPGLLMLRSLSEASSRDTNATEAKQNFVASVSSALTTYKLSPSIVFGFVAWAASSIGKRDEELAKELIVTLLKSYPNRELAREAIGQLPIALGDIPAWFLLAKLQEDCDSLIF